LFFEEEMARLERGRLYPVSIISADAEGLKEVNDREGHAGGDLLLRRIASLLSATLRSDDVIARVGGDEFAVLLAMTDEATVAEIILRIRTRLTEESGTIIGLSLGAATARKGDRLIDTLNKADDAMYRDKYQRTGRHSRRTFPSTPCPHEEPEPL
jgi:diguanylate cyclase (GGDEF)-like protein